MMGRSNFGEAIKSALPAPRLGGGRRNQRRMHERQRAYSGLIDFARTIRGKGTLALQCNRRIAAQLYEELADVFAGIANYCATCSGDDGDGGEGHDISIRYDYYPRERCSGAVSKTGARAFSCVQLTTTDSDEGEEDECGTLLGERRLPAVMRTGDSSLGVGGGGASRHARSCGDAENGRADTRDNSAACGGGATATRAAARAATAGTNDPAEFVGHLSGKTFGNVSHPHHADSKMTSAFSTNSVLSVRGGPSGDTRGSRRGGRHGHSNDRSQEIDSSTRWRALLKPAAHHVVGDHRRMFE